MKQKHSIGIKIAVLGRLLAKRSNEGFTGTGLSASQWSVLKCLRNEEALTQSEIAMRLSLEAPTVSKTVLILEQAGWVQRIADEKDRREKKVIATEQAKKQFPLWQAVASKVAQEALAGFSCEEQLMLESMIDRITVNLTDRAKQGGAIQ
ncbi:MAG: MarR family transcriptional regulator [Sporomusaceae bacterium]|nr:MarR family transcriptional regulator [Sporomusaceae bacterium]